MRMKSIYNATESTRIQGIKQRNIAYQSTAKPGGIDEEAGKIQKIDLHRFQDLAMSSNTIFAFNKGKSEYAERYSENPNKYAVYEEFTAKALNALTGKTGSGEWLMHSAVEMSDLQYSMNKANAAGSWDDVKNSMSALNGFRSGTGASSMYVFDLEALSGTNKYGQQDIDQLTEYAFGKYDNTGKLLETHTGIIGIDQKTADKYHEVAKTFSSNGFKEDKERVALEYFAKLGHKDTKYSRAFGQKGIWQIDKYTAEEASNILTEENIKRGIDRSLSIGNDQRANLVNGKMAWENVFTSVMDNIQKETNAGTAVVSGQNILKYDFPQINKVGAQRGWNPYHINKNSIIDTTPFLRHAALDSNFVSNMYGDKVGMIKGSTPFTLSTMVKAFIGEDFYEKSGLGAHSALADIQAFYKLFFNSDRDILGMAYNTAKKQYSNELSSKIVGGGQQLYYAKDASKHSGDILDFTVDQFTENIHTSDGTVIDKSGKATNAFKESVIKKDMTYTVNSVKALSMNDEYVKVMQKLYPELAVKDLVIMEMSPVIDSSVSDADLLGKSNMSIYRIGTKENLETAMGQDMILAGVKNAKGEYVMPDAAQQELKRFDIIRGTDGSLQHVAKETSAQSLIEDATNVFVNDTAARKVREDGFKTYSNYLNLIDELNKNINAVDPVERKAERKALLQEMIKQSSAVAQGAPVVIEGQLGRMKPLQELLGYKDYSTGKQTVWRHTVDNAVATLDYMESMQDDMRFLLNKVNNLAGENGSESYKRFLFSQGIDAYRANMMSMAGMSTNQTVGYVRGFQANTFDIDVTSLQAKKNYTTINKSIEKSGAENIKTINLGSGSEYNLINIANSLGRSKGDGLNKEAGTIARLSILVKHMQKQGIFGDEIVSGILSKEDSTAMAQATVAALKDIKKENPNAGILKSSMRQDVVSPHELSSGTGIFAEKKLEKIFGFLDNQEYSVANFAELKKDGDHKQFINKLVNNFFVDKMPDNSVLANYGYNERAIKQLKALHSTHIKDTTKMVEQLVTATANAGGSIYADPFKDKFGMMFGDKFYDMSFMPRLRFNNGMFYTVAGDSAVSANTRLVYDEYSTLGHAFKLQSALGESMGKFFNLSRTVEDARHRREDPAEAIYRTMKRVTNQVRSGAETMFGGASVAKFDQQDIKSQFDVDVSNVVKNMPDLKDKLLSGDIPLFDKEDFINGIESDNYMFAGKLNYKMTVLMQRNLPTILEEINKKTVDQEVKDTIGAGMNYHAKGSAAEKGKIRVNDIHYGPDQFMNGSRGITEQIKFSSFSENSTKRFLKDSGLDSDISIGNNLLTAQGRAITQRMSDGFGIADRGMTEITASRVIMNANMLGQRIAKFKSEEAMSAAERKAALVLSNVANIEEGGAVGDARIADNIFTSYDIQKISIKKEIAEQNFENLNTIGKLQNYHKVMPTISISSDGTINFQYEKGQLVNNRQKLFAIDGFSGEEIVRAKSNGVFNFGFFEKGSGKLVKEENVIAAVSRHAEKYNTKITNAQDFMSAANNLFDGSFYVNSLHERAYKKLVEDRAEKHMTYFAYMGLGTSETGLKKEEKVISNVLREAGLGRYIGQTLNHNIFKQFGADDIGKTIIADMSKEKNLSHDAFESIVKKHMGDGATTKDFYNMITRERYMASDVLRKITGGASFINQTDAAKHKTAFDPVMTGINEMIGQRQARGLSKEEATEQVYHKVKDYFHGDNGTAGITINENKELVLGKMSYEGGGKIHWGTNAEGKAGLEQVFSDDIGKDEWRNLFRYGGKSRHSYGVNDDWSGLAENKAKIGGRELNMMGFDKYTKTSLDEVKEAMTKRGAGAVYDDVFGHVTKQGLGGKSMLDVFINTVKRQGVDKDGRLEELKVLESGRIAINYNANGSGAEDLVKAGFKKVGLNDLVIPNGGDGEYIQRSNMVVSLKDNIITDDVLSMSKTLKNKDHIAIAGNLPLMAGDEAILPEYQHKMNSLARIRNELEAELNRGDAANSKRISSLKTVFVNTLDEINEKQSRYIKSKDKGSVVKRLDTVEMDKSIMGKGSVADPRGGGKMFENAIIEGKSVAEHARNGVFYNASFRSKAAFESMGFFDEEYMQEVFKDKNKYANLWKKDGTFLYDEAERQMEGRLSKHGVAGFVHRYPTAYRYSSTSAQIYMNKDLADNVMVDTIHGAMFRNQDSDGDNIETIIARFYDENGELKDQLQNGEHKGFQGIRSQHNLHAYVHNQRAEIKMQANREEAVKKQASENYINEVAMSNNPTGDNDGYMRPRMTKGITKSAYDSLDDKARYMAEREQAAGVAAVKRGNAGTMNLPNFTLRKLEDMSYNSGAQFSEKQRVALDAMLEASEEAFLSPKHSEKEIVENTSVLDDYSSALRKIMSKKAETAEQGRQDLVEWFGKHASNRIRKELYAHSGMDEKEFAETAAGVVHDIFSNANAAYEYKNYLKENTVRPENINEAFNVPAEDNSLHAANMRDARNAFSDGTVSEQVQEKPYFKQVSRVQQTSEQIRNAEREAVSSEAVEQATHMVYGRKRMAEYTDNAITRTVSMARKHGINSRNIAKGAVGLAGAIMMAGFVGGNPSTPAGTEGQVMYDGETGDTGFQMPALTDSNVMKSQNSGPTKGYVININAQTNQGQQHAQQAINTAMGATFSRSNVNISMNINDNTRNITNSRQQDGDVLGYIQGALS